MASRKRRKSLMTRLREVVQEGQKELAFEVGGLRQDLERVERQLRAQKRLLQRPIALPEGYHYDQNAVPNAYYYFIRGPFPPPPSIERALRKQEFAEAKSKSSCSSSWPHTEYWGPETVPLPDSSDEEESDTDHEVVRLSEDYVASFGAAMDQVKHLGNGLQSLAIDEQALERIRRAQELQQLRQASQPDRDPFSESHEEMPAEYLGVTRKIQQQGPPSQADSNAFSDGQEELLVDPCCSGERLERDRRARMKGTSLRRSGPGRTALLGGQGPRHYSSYIRPSLPPPGSTIVRQSQSTSPTLVEVPCATEHSPETLATLHHEQLLDGYDSDISEATISEESDRLETPQLDERARSDSAQSHQSEISEAPRPARMIQYTQSCGCVLCMHGNIWSRYTDVITQSIEHVRKADPAAIRQALTEMDASGYPMLEQNKRLPSARILVKLFQHKHYYCPKIQAYCTQHRQDMLKDYLELDTIVAKKVAYNRLTQQSLGLQDTVTVGRAMLTITANVTAAFARPWGEHCVDCAVSEECRALVNEAPKMCKGCVVVEDGLVSDKE